MDIHPFHQFRDSLSVAMASSDKLHMMDSALDDFK